MSEEPPNYYVLYNLTPPGENDNARSPPPYDCDNEITPLELQALDRQYQRYQQTYRALPIVCHNPPPPTIRQVQQQVQQLQNQDVDSCNCCIAVMLLCFIMGLCIYFFFIYDECYYSHFREYEKCNNASIVNENLQSRDNKTFLQ
jgi:hypothetical protein